MLRKVILGLLVISLLEINNVYSQLVHMEPSGYRIEGETVEITCTLNDTQNYNIDDLVFTYNNKNSPKIPADKIEDITKGNYTKLLRISNPSMMECNVDCMVRGLGVDRTVVQIGTKPQKVIDFKCRSYGWENLTCSFERPNNPVSVNYNLYYRPGIDEKDYEEPNHPCSLKPNFNRVFSCSIGFQSEPPYRQSYPYYFFRLEEKNSLGLRSEEFTIDHFNIVIPSAPENVIATNITSNSAVLNWRLSPTFGNFRKQFVYMIFYAINTEKLDPAKLEWVQLGPFTEQKHGPGPRPNNYTFQKLINLPYAYTCYDCRISFKVENADEIPEMWSVNGTHVFATASRKPDKPPLTDIGSFRFTDSDHVYIYWKQLHATEENGKHLRYKIFDPQNVSFTSTSTYIRLEHIDPKNMVQPLVIRIYSENDEGLSTSYSTVNIPTIHNRCNPPPKIKKVRQNNGTYDLSWESPSEGPKITSYTVFWCETNNDSPTDCKGSINFKRVNGDVFNYRLKTNISMNFAVSANSDTSSSGMHWAMCTVLPGKEMNKLTSINTMKVESTFIDFKWNLQCITDPSKNKTAN